MKKAEELKIMAVGLGACKEGLDGWSQAPTDDELITRYVEHIKFCIKHDFPRVEYIKAHFSRDALHKNGVFVDEKIKKTPTLRCVANGRCSGKIEFERRDVQSLHVCHDSVVEVCAKDNSIVFVYIYENAKVMATAIDKAKICVFYFGGEITKADGNVVIRDCRKGEVE